MPRIPIVNVEGQAAVERFPQEFPVSRQIDYRNLSTESFAAKAFEQIANLGEKFVDVAQKIERQRDDMEVVEATSRYDTGLAEIRLKLKENIDYGSHEIEFLKKSSDLYKSVEGAFVTTPISRQTFRKHVIRTLPKELIEIKANSLKLAGEEQLSKLDQQEEELSLRAAEAITIDDRDDAIRLYTNLIDRTRERGLLSPVKSEQKKISFKHKMLEKNMDFLRRTNVSRLWELDRQGAFAEIDPIKKLKILEAARLDEEKSIVRDERVFKNAQEIVERQWSSLANQGALPDNVLEGALKGEDPFISPDKARQYKTINSNPPIGGGGGSLSIRVVMQEYHSGPSTQKRIEKARSNLLGLIKELNQADPLIDKAFNELQTDERTMRGINAAELSAGIKFAEDEYKANIPPVLPGRLGTIQRNQQASDLSELRNQIRRGKKPIEAVNEMLKKRQKDAKDMPDRTKSVLDLLK